MERKVDPRVGEVRLPVPVSVNEYVQAPRVPWRAGAGAVGGRRAAGNGAAGGALVQRRRALGLELAEARNPALRPDVATSTG